MAVLILASLAAGYGLSGARASHADPNTVHLCVNSFTKEIRYVVNPSQCAGGFVVEVNKQGVPGPAGPAGPPGATGPAGPPGPAGLGATYYLEEAVAVPANGVVTRQLQCNSGDTIISGGYSKVTDPGSNTLLTGDAARDLVIVDNRPVVFVESSWVVSASNRDLLNDWAIKVHAYCLDT